MQWLFDIVIAMMEDAGFIRMSDVGDAGYINDWARARIWQDTIQPIPNVAFTKVMFEQVSFSNRVTVDLEFNRLIIQDTGWYLIASSVGINHIGAPKRIHTGIKIGGVWITYVTAACSWVNEDPRTPTVGIWYLSEGDILDLWVYHNHGLARNTLNQEVSTWLAIHRLS